jgi:hypothetical protein
MGCSKTIITGSNVAGIAIMSAGVLASGYLEAQAKRAKCQSG